ncbi:MAG: hypothetical protein CUN54_09765, partial [Phototrophicales bacterium]
MSLRFNTFIHGLFFVAGFAFVFVSLGLLLTAFITEIGGGQNVVLATDIIGRVGGIIIIFFGFHFMGVLPSVFGRIRKNQDTLDNPVVTVLIALIVAAILLWAFIVPEIAATVIAIFVLWLVLGGGFTQPGAFWMKALSTVERGLYSDTRKQMTAQGGGGYT